MMVETDFNLSDLIAGAEILIYNWLSFSAARVCVQQRNKVDGQIW